MAASNLSGQIADFAQAVTTSDTASNQYTYLYVGGAGNVSVIPEGASPNTTQPRRKPNREYHCRTASRQCY